MKCPKCGSINGKTNKFCRMCGARVEGLVQPEARPAEMFIHAPDELELGEELFDVWKLYESGDLEVAAGKVEKIIETSPESTSALSLLALIHERRAEEAMADGDILSAQGFLQQAVARQEKVIDLNPDSAADREKLVSLRMKLSGHTTILPISPRRVRKLAPASLRAALKSAPPQVLAAVGVFFVIVVLGITLIPGGDEKEARVTVTPSSAPDDGRIRVPFTPSGTEQPRANVALAAGPNDLKVYTYPAPQPQTRPFGNAVAPRPTLAGPELPSASVEPARLPPLGAELTLTPESKSIVSVRPAQPKQGAKAKVTSEAQPVKPEPVAQPDGSSLLAAAIELQNQGRSQEAIISAEQAVSRFQADIAVGKNVTAAQRGADNARKFIQIWQQSASSTAEQ
ncbi:MAG: hypothetical protein M1133_14630 [Armatimonadetes bacterium]|nr:hypothetical protein [Armatimonadota bacterium]